MSNVVMAIAGMMLIGFGFVAMLFLLPQTIAYTDTGANSTWENQSAYVKSTVGILGQAALIFPFLFFVAGIGVFWKGVS